MLDIGMGMSIIMLMNIYITKENQKFLQSNRPKQSMSGFINGLIDNYRNQKPSVVVKTVINEPKVIKQPKDVLEAIEPPVKNFLDKKKGTR